MTKKFIYAFSFLLILSASVFSSASQAATIRISAPKVELDLAAGETYSGEIAVENPDNEEVKVKVYLEDWNYKPGGSGEKDFAPAGSTPLSASKWITFSPASDTMKPYGRISAHYSIAVPKDAKGAYFSVLFFETVIGTAKD